MKLKSLTYKGSLLCILLFFALLPSKTYAQQPAQLVANYIAVEDAEGLGILFGEVIGKPEVTDDV